MGCIMAEPIKIVPICDGEYHLENKITNFNCYICNKKFDDNMVLLRRDNNEFGFACLEREGIVQEFLRQYKRVPIGWVLKKDQQNEMGT